jgi:hypothetical protein
MDIAHGVGMLGVGLIVILIGGTIIFLVINKIEKLEQEKKENKLNSLRGLK